MNENRDNSIQIVMKRMRLLVIISLAALLFGCASLTGPKPALNQTIPWKKRKQSLSNIEQWNASGSILIKTPSKAESASVDWRQDHKDYTIELYGPLGLGGATINGENGKVTLTQSNGQILTANDPEALIQKALGWRLPISNLYYWIRGIPAPMPYKNHELDIYNHLIFLEQQGWSIHYIRYTGVKDQDLPYEITLMRHHLFIKIVVDQWSI